MPVRSSGDEEIEYEEEMEKIFVPVRRSEARQDDELREEPDDVKVREIPRRWRVYQ